MSAVAAVSLTIRFRDGVASEWIVHAEVSKAMLVKAGICESESAKVLLMKAGQNG